jgi:hypothetical protein
MLFVYRKLHFVGYQNHPKISILKKIPKSHRQILGCANTEGLMDRAACSNFCQLSAALSKLVHMKECESSEVEIWKMAYQNPMCLKVLSKKFKRQPKKETVAFLTATTAPAQCIATQNNLKPWQEQ